MNRFYINNPMYVLTLAWIIFVCCNGQSTTQTHTDKNTIHPIPEGNPKMVKTQGTGPYDNVHCMLEDQKGNIWFGTTGEGLYKYDGVSFFNFTEKDGLCGNSIGSIMEDQKGNIWIGTLNKGLCIYDGKSFSRVSILPENSGKSIPFTEKNIHNSPTSIWSMLQDKSGNIWICTNEGVYAFDGISFTRFLDQDKIIYESELNLRHVSSILEDKKGNIWFTTWFEGVCRYDGKSIQRFTPHNEVWFSTIFEDKTGNIWIGRREKGVLRYDGQEFTDIFKDIKIINNCCVQAITEDSAGNIWFGTEAGNMTRRESSGGIWLYKPSGSADHQDGLRNFTVKDGLTNHSVFSLGCDKRGMLWIGCRGMSLCRFDGKIFTEFVALNQQDQQPLNLLFPWRWITPAVNGC